MRNTQALASVAGVLWFASCGGAKFQSDQDAGGSGGTVGSGGTGSGGQSNTSGGSNSAGAIAMGGSVGVSGGVGGSSGGPAVGGAPAGGGPSGGADSGGAFMGSGGFNVAGDLGVAGSMVVSCATMAGTECLGCCKETIGAVDFVNVSYECGCSTNCYQECMEFCGGGVAMPLGCEICILGQYMNPSEPLCTGDRDQCNQNAQCFKYVDCANGCDL